MRRLFLVAVIVGSAALGWTAWPFLGLYQLGAALHSADAEGALGRIDVASVRRSILRQILDEGSKGTKIEKKFGDAGRQMAVNAATAVLDKRAAEIITADVLRELIATGRLPASFGQGIDVKIGALAEEAAGRASSGTSLGGIPDNPLRFIQSWRFKAPGRFEAVVGDSRRPDDRTGLTLRLKRLTWRLTAVKLPESVMNRVRPQIRAKIEAAKF